MTGVWALVPVKSLVQGKSRLVPALSPEDRQGLQMAMLRDVLRAVAGATALSGGLVVHSDDEVASLAEAQGLDSLRESGGARGLNAALAQGIAELERRSADAVLILPADLPLVTSEKIDVLVSSAAPMASVTLCSSHDGTGTNAMLLRPPDIIEPAFGAESFQRHRVAAQSAAAHVTALEIPAFALDIDEPSDLEYLLSLAHGGEAASYLRGLVSA